MQKRGELCHRNTGSRPQAPKRAKVGSPGRKPWERRHPVFKEFPCDVHHLQRLMKRGGPVLFTHFQVHRSLAPLARPVVTEQPWRGRKTCSKGVKARGLEIA